MSKNEEKTCKHKNGWSLLGETHLFVYPNIGKQYSKVEVGFSSENNKLLFECNNACGMVREIEVKAKVVAMGGIREPQGKETSLIDTRSKYFKKREG
jgi:hypothetical protein